jgi:hypothetical protein
VCKAGLIAALDRAVVPCQPLPKNAAQINCLLKSNTLILIKALANNLFHKICAEAWSGG